MSKLVQHKTPESRLADLEKRLAAVERRRPASLSFADDTRVRMRVGLQFDGKYGLRVWDAGGALVHDDTA